MHHIVVIIGKLVYSYISICLYLEIYNMRIDANWLQHNVNSSRFVFIILISKMGRHYFNKISDIAKRNQLRKKAQKLAMALMVQQLMLSIGLRVTHTTPSFVWWDDICFNFPIQYFIWISAMTEFHNSLRLRNIVEPLLLSTKLSLYHPYITSDTVLVLSRSD